MTRNDEEHRIQVGIMKAVELIPQCKWLHAIPNGGKRDKVTGARLKAEGVKAGVGDLFLPVPATHVMHRSGFVHNGIELAVTTIYHGLYIEVKTPEGPQRKKQKEFQADMEAAGYKYVIVRSVQAGVDVILEYMGMRK